MTVADGAVLKSSEWMVFLFRKINLQYPYDLQKKKRKKSETRIKKAINQLLSLGFSRFVVEKTPQLGQNCVYIRDNTTHIIAICFFNDNDYIALSGGHFLSFVKSHRKYCDL